MEPRSGVRLARRWRILLAHDANAPTCDPLVLSIENALGVVDLNDACSVDDARAALQTSTFDLCFVCLDLPPAPMGGVRLAQEILDDGHPVVLVTRSLRWIPPNAASLRDLPWLPPDAGEAQVQAAVGQAMASWVSREELVASVREPHAVLARR